VDESVLDVKQAVTAIRCFEPSSALTLYNRTLANNNPHAREKKDNVVDKHWRISLRPTK
jgi:hypothetical protein